jgi:flagellar motor switch protein FliN/FliY
VTKTTPEQDPTDGAASEPSSGAAAVEVATEAAPDGATDDATVQGFEPGVLPVSASQSTTAGGSLSALNDVQMVVTAELGRTTMPMRELLGLTPGVVVEIDRTAGSPIDLLVNGRRIASGEVVVIDEEFGIRITDIIASNASESRG